MILNQILSEMLERQTCFYQGQWQTKLMTWQDTHTEDTNWNDWMGQVPMIRWRQPRTFMIDRSFITNVILEKLIYKKLKRSALQFSGKYKNALRLHD